MNSQEELIDRFLENDPDFELLRCITATCDATEATSFHSEWPVFLITYHTKQFEVVSSGFAPGSFGKADRMIEAFDSRFRESLIREGRMEAFKWYKTSNYGPYRPDLIYVVVELVVNKIDKRLARLVDDFYSQLFSLDEDGKIEFATGEKMLDPSLLKINVEGRRKPEVSNEAHLQTRYSMSCSLIGYEGELIGIGNCMLSRTLFKLLHKDIAERIKEIPNAPRWSFNYVIT